MEQLAQSIQIDGKGIHVLLWDDQDDLVRSLMVLLAVLNDWSIRFFLLSSAEQAAKDLRQLFDLQIPTEDGLLSEMDSLRPPRKNLLVLFLQQATSSTIGPYLNGWRSALAEAPGTLLVIRKADFIDFQRNAPDLTSFFGPKIYDSSLMLSIWNENTAKKISPILPDKVRGILKELPGHPPLQPEIEEWIKHHTPLDE